MDPMDIDLPSDPGPLKPSDRVLRRLAQKGVPEEYLKLQYAGIVAYAVNNPGFIPELVTAILPPDDEVAMYLQESKKKAVNPSMKNWFRECAVWLQWLMFLDDPASALKGLSKMSSGRGVCGAVWGNDDIAYRCRTCEHDPTCAICVPCFQNGNHKDHDYSIIYTGGGCCDCGDVTAWKREGFCSRHKGAEQIQPLPEEYANSVGPVLDELFGFWKNKLVAAESLRGSDRVMVQKKVANKLTFVVVEMLLEFCKQSESLLSFVSRRINSLFGLLEILVRAERFLSKGVAKKLSELLLKLLGEPLFKYEFAKVFLSYYPVVVNEVIKERSDDAYKKYPLLSTFSVQIFTVPTLTPRLVKEMNLLTMLLGCLGDIFVHCSGEDGHLQVSKWANMYNTTLRVVEDIRFVMSHGVVPKYVTHDQKDVLKTWMKLLSFLQGMSSLKRQTGFHIEEENEKMNLPFVLGHSVASVHLLLVDGAFATSEEMDGDIFSNVYKQEIDEGESVRHAKVGRLSEESAACGVTGRSSSRSPTNVAEVNLDSICHPLIPSSVTWLTYECLKAIESWLEADNTLGIAQNSSNISTTNFLELKRTLSKIRKGRYIFGARTSFNEEHSKHGSPPSHSCSRIGDAERAKNLCQDGKTVVSSETDSSVLNDSLMEADSASELDPLRVLSLADWPEINYDVSSQELSIHVPLHRILSLLLQKALRKFYAESAVLGVRGASGEIPLFSNNDDIFRRLLGGCHPYGFSAFIMEHPLRNRVFFAEVHAGMWRKNGDAAILSCEWYRSVRWAEQGLELDLFLLQCCAALAPADLFVKRIVERFGLLEYLSLSSERSSEYEPGLVQDMLKLIIQIVQERRFSGLTPAENLRRELVVKLSIGDATHSQLVKSLPRDISKFDRLQEILDTVAVYSNPSGFNQGMYSLRWAYWKELDLYHPRWNLRDLQVAEERYTRYCSVSALTTQLPRWTKIYPPLKGVARIATCKVVLQIIRAVLFYAVFNDKLMEARAPDGVLLTALHLLSLALDICLEQKENADMLDSIAFAAEEIHERLDYGAGDQSLLSLLVSLIRMHKRENMDNFLEAGGCNLSSLIESLLKKFAEIDLGCMTKLQQLAPEVVLHLSQLAPSSDANKLGSSSDSEKRKAKARERQAAVLAKMRAEQSKFLSSINSSADDDSKSELDESNSDDGQVLEEAAPVVCSLCHDPNSKDAISFLILLQKSRLLSFIDRGPPSWDQVQQSDQEHPLVTTNKATDPSVKISFTSGLAATNESGMNSLSGSWRVFSSSQLAQLVLNAMNEFAGYAQPGEVNAVMEFFRAQLPSLRSTQVQFTSRDIVDRTEVSFEQLEQDMYVSIWKELCRDMPLSSNEVNNKKFSSTDGGEKSGRGAESVLLGKYIAALSRERTKHTGASEYTHNDKAKAESTSHSSAYIGFSPPDCDGIHLSSCGHAVHQGCLDSYLSSLRERHIRRIVFEGGHIVDPDQGEFLCPVCRRLANSVLPSLPGDFQKVWMQPLISTVGSSPDAGPLAASSRESNSLWLQQALSLLQSAAMIVEKGDILKTFPLQQNERMRSNLDSISRVLSKQYFPNRHDKFTEPARVNHSMIMWDTLKYTLVSMEIASRCGRSNMIPTYSLSSLYKELKSSSGFTLSLLLKVVHCLRRKNSLHVLQRFRGIQLFAESICSGVSEDNASNSNGSGGMSCILKHIEEDILYPDTQFWSRAADPVLAHDAFSSLLWVLFCLPSPFLSCEESLLSLVHMFYVVSVAQAIISYFGKHQHERETGFHDSLITDICKVLGESAWIQHYFCSNYIDPSTDIEDTIRKLSFPYLRRCALLWKLLTTSIPAPFCDRDHRDHVYTRSSVNFCDTMDSAVDDLLVVDEVKKLEKMFKMPPLKDVLKDQKLRSLVVKWLNHFSKAYEIHNFQRVLHITPVVPFKLMCLPHLYQDLPQRYIKQRCADCKNVPDEPALCLLCGKLCSPNWKLCCRESGCQTHAVVCGAGTGVFLLIRRTTILLQRCARQAPWPSPYLDAFGEEDIEMHRGKPLYLNEERYAALSYMVASHGLDQSSKVLGQTTIGTFFLG